MMGGPLTSGLRRLAGAALCGLAVALVASCTPRVSNDPKSPEVVFRAPVKAEQSHYLAQLKDLPLRTGDAHWSVNLRPGVNCLVREVHLLRDLHEDREDARPAAGEATDAAGKARARRTDRDLILVVYDDNFVQAVSARDFTIKWMSALRSRTFYAPVMTSNSVFFIATNGEYQQFDRKSGALVRSSNFGVSVFPSGQMSANDTHVIMPTTNQNGLRAVADWDGERLVGAPQNWGFPNRFTNLSHRFDMVQLQPVADREAIYFVGNNNYLYGIDAQTGDLRFAKDLGRTGIVRTAPILHNNVIYCGSDSQLFAFSRSGEVLWSFTADGPIEGPLYAMDDQVFFRTLRFDSSEDRGGKYGGLTSTRTTQAGGGTTVRTVPQSFGSVSMSRILPPILDPDADLVPGEPPPLRRDAQGEIIPDTPVVRHPVKFDWKTENLGQEVLLKTKSAIFVKLEEWVVPFTPEEERRLRNSGKVVKDEELRQTTRRIVQMLDARTGTVMTNGGETAQYELAEFPFVIGSQDPTDRALYFVTHDGYLFKGFAIN